MSIPKVICRLAKLGRNYNTFVINQVVITLIQYFPLYLASYKMLKHVRPKEEDYNGSQQ